MGKNRSNALASIDSLIEYFDGNESTNGRKCIEIRSAVTELIEAARLGGDMPKKEGAEHAGMFFTADNAARLRAALAALAGGAA